MALGLDDEGSRAEYERRYGQPLDQLYVDVEAKKETYDLGPQKIGEVEKMIEAKLRGIIGIGVKIRLVAPKAITRSEGKAKRVIDERKM